MKNFVFFSVFLLGFSIFAPSLPSKNHIEFSVSGSQSSVIVPISAENLAQKLQEKSGKYKMENFSPERIFEHFFIEPIPTENPEKVLNFLSFIFSGLISENPEDEIFDQISKLFKVDEKISMYIFLANKTDFNHCLETVKNIAITRRISTQIGQKTVFSFPIEAKNVQKIVVEDFCKRQQQRVDRTLENIDEIAGMENLPDLQIFIFFDTKTHIWAKKNPEIFAIMKKLTENFVPENGIKNHIKYLEKRKFER